MPKPQKIEAVKEIADRLKKAEGALLTEFRGLRVEEMKELRNALRDKGTEFKVVKNTLTRLALKDAKLEDLLPLIEGSTAIAFIKGDPVEAAKGLDEMAKKYPALSVKGGIVEGKILDAAQASALAKVKPKDVLLAQLAGMIQQPVQQLANLLTAPLRSLGYALGAYLEEAEKAAPAAAPEPEPEAAAPEPEPEAAAPEPEPEAAAPEPEPEAAAPEPEPEAVEEERPKQVAEEVPPEPEPATTESEESPAETAEPAEEDTTTAESGTENKEE